MSYFCLLGLDILVKSNPPFGVKIFDNLNIRHLRMSESVHLDGTTLEGGGQLVRLALGLSALTSTPIKFTNIRGNRSGGGGLKQQHLTAVNWLASACSATVSGAERKNRTLEFCPLREVSTH